jgi:hypothetical protein
MACCLQEWAERRMAIFSLLLPKPTLEEASSFVSDRVFEAPDCADPMVVILAEVFLLVFLLAMRAAFVWIVS